MAVIAASGETHRKLCASQAVPYLDSRDVAPNSSGLTPGQGSAGLVLDADAWAGPKPRNPGALGLLRSGRLP